jgi:peroxiredoxin
MIEKGSKAPDFRLESTYREVSLHDYYGQKNIMLIFYPLDWTNN